MAAPETPIFCLMGPTGAGKTAAALWLAARRPVEILSVDSALVYRGMDIGTAKPNPAERARVPHHLVDCCLPEDTFSVAQFLDAMRQLLPGVRARGRIPLLVGGTGLYFRRLEQGLADIPAVPPEVRAAVADDLARLGKQALHKALAAVDPASAARIHPNDPQRVTRALEVFRATGRPLSTWVLASAGQGWPLRKVVLAPAGRRALDQRLARRFHGMLERGFLNEVRALRGREGLTAAHPAMRAVGYREAWAHLDGELDRASMVRRVIDSTRHYAKRQYTWFRGEERACWLDPDQPGTRDSLLEMLDDTGGGQFDGV